MLRNYRKSALQFGTLSLAHNTRKQSPATAKKGLRHYNAVTDLQHRTIT
ncbi:hypothetical protein [Saccharomonospora piscinae]|nr:hypothetical protein [Saccharomonospora piscinae]